MKIAVVQDYMQIQGMTGNYAFNLDAGDVGGVIEETEEFYLVDFNRGSLVEFDKTHPIAIYDISDVEPEHLGEVE